MGSTKTKSLIGEKVYWQGMDKEVRNFINKCIAFQANTEMPNLTPLNIMDLHSRFPIAEVMKTTNAAALIYRFEKLISIFGFPASIKHDNGPSFHRSEFRDYLKSVDIRGAPIIPKHLESNAAVESFNRPLKKLL